MTDIKDCYSQFKEKDFLQKHVPELSRLLVGKTKGQNIWSRDNVPKNWPIELKWKNPTSCPKDTIKELQFKFDWLTSETKAQNLLAEEQLIIFDLFDERNIEKLVTFIEMLNILKDLKKRNEHLKCNDKLVLNMNTFFSKKATEIAIEVNTLSQKLNLFSNRSVDVFLDHNEFETSDSKLFCNQEVLSTTNDTMTEQKQASSLFSTEEQRHHFEVHDNHLNKKNTINLATLKNLANILEDLQKCEKSFPNASLSPDKQNETFIPLKDIDNKLEAKKNVELSEDCQDNIDSEFLSEIPTNDSPNLTEKSKSLNSNDVSNVKSSESPNSLSNVRSSEFPNSLSFQEMKNVDGEQILVSNKKAYGRKRKYSSELGNESLSEEFKSSKRSSQELSSNSFQFDCSQSPTESGIGSMETVTDNVCENIELDSSEDPSSNLDKKTQNDTWDKSSDLNFTCLATVSDSAESETSKDQTSDPTCPNLDIKNSDLNYDEINLAKFWQSFLQS